MQDYSNFYFLHKVVLRWWHTKPLFAQGLCFVFWWWLLRELQRQSTIGRTSWQKKAANNKDVAWFSKGNLYPESFVYFVFFWLFFYYFQFGWYVHNHNLGSIVCIAFKRCSLLCGSHYYLLHSATLFLHSLPISVFTCLIRSWRNRRKKN